MPTTPSSEALTLAELVAWTNLRRRVFSYFYTILLLYDAAHLVGALVPPRDEQVASPGRVPQQRPRQCVVALVPLSRTCKIHRMRQVVSRGEE